MKSTISVELIMKRKREESVGIQLQDINLPADLLFKVFNLLPSKDILNASRVNRRWNAIAETMFQVNYRDQIRAATNNTSMQINNKIIFFSLANSLRMYVRSLINLAELTVIPHGQTNNVMADMTIDKIALFYHRQSLRLFSTYQPSVLATYLIEIFSEIQAEEVRVFLMHLFLLSKAPESAKLLIEAHKFEQTALDEGLEFLLMVASKLQKNDKTILDKIYIMAEYLIKKHKADIDFNNGFNNYSDKSCNTMVIYWFALCRIKFKDLSNTHFRLLALIYVSASEQNKTVLEKEWQSALEDYTGPKLAEATQEKRSWLEEAISRQKNVMVYVTELKDNKDKLLGLEVKRT